MNSPAGTEAMPAMDALFSGGGEASTGREINCGGLGDRIRRFKFSFSGLIREWTRLNGLMDFGGTSPTWQVRHSVPVVFS